MVAGNRESLELDYNDLSDEHGEPDITYFLPEAPNEVEWERFKIKFIRLILMIFKVLEHLNKGATAVVISIFPWYHRITNEIKVRIKNLPMEEDIRMLRQVHLNMLIKTTGIVTITTGILPQLSIVKYDCKSCSYVLGPFVQRQDEETKPSTCPSCQSRGPFELNTEEV